tara:strand:+ start:189 stop:833 length:645 start_codon:yes stop_codon:yes gene_type:complete
MDQDIEIINNQTRLEKFNNFFKKNLKLIISIIVTFVFILIVIFSFQIYKTNKKNQIANKFNLTISMFDQGEQNKVISSMKEIINDKDSTYSPLALYFLIDNKIDLPNDEINSYFDIIIEEVKLDEEIKNLNIFKKALFNSESETEDTMLKILKPLINSDSIWKSHALFLMGEYYYSNKEKQKSIEFFNKIIEVPNANPAIKLEAQRRIKRDLSD